jgi:hypothetical protein
MDESCKTRQRDGENQQRDQDQAERLDFAWAASLAA